MPSPYITRRFLSGCSCSCIRAARSGGSPTGYSDSEYRPEAGFRQYVWAQYCYSLKVPDTSANTDADFCLAHTFLPVKHPIWRKNNPSIRPSICCYICLVCFERVNKKNKKQRKTLSDKRSVRKKENPSVCPPTCSGWRCVSWRGGVCISAGSSSCLRPCWRSSWVPGARLCCRSCWGAARHLKENHTLI